MISSYDLDIICSNSNPDVYLEMIMFLNELGQRVVHSQSNQVGDSSSKELILTHLGVMKTSGEGFGSASIQWALENRSISRCPVQTIIAVAVVRKSKMEVGKSCPNHIRRSQRLRSPFSCRFLI